MAEQTDGPILVVDDDPEIQRELAAILALEGFPVEVAGNGLAAERAIATLNPALILLDFHLPFWDADQLIDHLRSQGRDIPVVLMTGDRSAAQRAAELGAVGCLLKPFDLGELLETVSRHIRRARPWWQRILG